MVSEQNGAAYELGVNMGILSFHVTAGNLFEVFNAMQPVISIPPSKLRAVGGLSRRQKEKRAYGLTLVTGGASLAAIVFLVTAIVGVTSLGLFFLAVVIAAVAGFMLRGTLRR